jgi:hypothetical protein
MSANDTNKKIIKFLPILFLFFIFIPIFTNAAPIIPCTDNCGYNDLLQLVNNIINWIILISVPVAAGVFAWAGFTYMTTGISDRKSYAKSMITKVFLGFVFILAAWLIVGTIIKALLNPSITVPVQININKSINFYV